MNLYSKSEIFDQIEQFLTDDSDGVIEILGATASGKTGFSIELAKKLEREGRGECEVISVDSRQVYRECDVSSAKISEKEMDGVTHWGIDLVDLDQEYSVYDFQQYAFEKIEEIKSRGNIPILCGGTTLWLDAVSENYVFSEQVAVSNKQLANCHSEERSDEESIGRSDRSFSNVQDDKIKFEKSEKKGTAKWPVLKIGIYWDRDILYERINGRAAGQFEGGLVDETKVILEKYSLTDGNWCECKFDDRVVRIPNDPSKTKMARNVSSSFGYAEIGAYLAGVVSYEEALELNRKRNRNYAKRQLTWWRGREDVMWMDLR